MRKPVRTLKVKGYQSGGPVTYGAALAAQDQALSDVRDAEKAGRADNWSDKSMAASRDAASDAVSRLGTPGTYKPAPGMRKGGKVKKVLRRK